MHQRFTVAVHRRDERRNVLQIGFSGHALLEIGGVAALQAAFIGRVVNDFAFLSGCDLTHINVEQDAAFLAQMPQKREFFGAGRIAAQGQDTAEGAPEDEMVGAEFDHRGRNQIKIILRRRAGRSRFPLIFLLLFDNLLLVLFTHFVIPTFLHRCYRNIPLSRPAGSKSRGFA